MAEGKVISIQVNLWENILLRHLQTGYATQLTLLKTTGKAFFWFQSHSALLCLRSEAKNTDWVKSKKKQPKKREGFRANRKLHQTFIIGLVTELEAYGGDLISAPFSVATALSVSRIAKEQVTLDVGFCNGVQVEKVTATTQLPRGFHIPAVESIEYRNRGQDNRVYDSELRERIAQKDDAA